MFDTNTGFCKCKTGFVHIGKDGDGCKPIKCPDNASLNKDTGLCKCNENFAHRGDKCLPLCPANATFDKMNNRCKCDKGFAQKGNGCVSDANKCPPNGYDDKTGQCKCNKGYFLIENACLTMKELVVAKEKYLRITKGLQAFLQKV